jgi:hypothetical protein
MMKPGSKDWQLAQAWYAAGRLHSYVCPRCNVGGNDIPDGCTAPIEGPCPGFVEMERFVAEFVANWRKLAGATGEAA